jgi:hypothetical protein
MLSPAEPAVLDAAFQKYRAGRNEPVLVGGITLLKPALRLMTDYRLTIQEVEGPGVLTSYTRWIESGATQGRRKPGSLRDVQPPIRTHLVRVKEAPSELYGAKAGQHRAPEPIRSSPVQLGKEIRRGRN